MSSFALSEFKIASAVCEVRYPEAYKLWDNAGGIWSSCEKLWPSLKMKKAEPNITSFKLDDKKEIIAQLDRAHVLQVLPKSSLKDFIEDASAFFDILFDILEVNEFTRIGFRLTFSKNFDNKESASSYVNSINELQFSKEKSFGIEPNFIFPSHAVRFEGDTLGVMAKINLIKIELDIEIPPDITDMVSEHKEYQQIIVDYDYYTLKPAKKGQIKISEWIELAFRSIKRDHESFWKGFN